MTVIIGAPYLSICPEQTRLLNLRSEAATRYAEATLHLAAATGRLRSPQAYTTLLAAVKDARAKTERAREAFRRHCDEHGC
jgi:hypothetical protein